MWGSIVGDGIRISGLSSFGSGVCVVMGGQNLLKGQFHVGWLSQPVVLWRLFAGFLSKVLTVVWTIKKKN